MMKRLMKLISAILIITILGTSVAFADDSEITIQPRSRYLAAGISEITNEGEGVLGIYADFTSYNSVKWASLTITLQKKKSADSGEWTNAKTYVYEFDAEDEPDGRLTYGAAEFEVRGMETNCYYRVKCVHKVKTPDDTYESKTSQTSGVLLTSYPVFRSQSEEN